MKKGFLVILIVVMMFVNTACNHETAVDSGLKVTIINNSQTEIYGISFAYFLDDKALGGGAVTAADGKPIAAGASFAWSEFSQIEEQQEFTVRCGVLLAEEVEIPCEPSVTFSNRQAKEYIYILTGNPTDGFALTPQ